MTSRMVILVGILATAGIMTTWLWSRSNRYAAVGAGDGKMYVLDRRTGAAVLVVGTKEQSLDHAPSRQPTEEARAIELAKQSNAVDLGQLGNSDQEIRGYLEDQKGKLHVTGWECRRIDD